MTTSTTNGEPYSLTTDPDYSTTPIGMAHYQTHDGRMFIAARCYGKFRCFPNHDDHNGCADARAWIASTLRAWIRKNDTTKAGAR